MPRYLVERIFDEGLKISSDTLGADNCLKIIRNNIIDEVTWLHSIVSADKLKTFCIYDAASPEAVRRASKRNLLPIEKITEISVLNPYFYLSH